jgi:hypothetical protein
VETGQASVVVRRGRKGDKGRRHEITLAEASEDEWSSEESFWSDNEYAG